MQLISGEKIHYSGTRVAAYPLRFVETEGTLHIDCAAYDPVTITPRFSKALFVPTRWPYVIFAENYWYRSQWGAGDIASHYYRAGGGFGPVRLLGDKILAAGPYTNGWINLYDQDGTWLADFYYNNGYAYFFVIHGYDPDTNKAILSYRYSNSYYPMYVGEIFQLEPFGRSATYRYYFNHTNTMSLADVANGRCVLFDSYSVSCQFRVRTIDYSSHALTSLLTLNGSRNGHSTVSKPRWVGNEMLFYAAQANNNANLGFIIREFHVDTLSWTVSYSSYTPTGVSIPYFNSPNNGTYHLTFETTNHILVAMVENSYFNSNNLDVLQFYAISKTSWTVSDTISLAHGIERARHVMPITDDLSIFVVINDSVFRFISFDDSTGSFSELQTIPTRVESLAVDRANRLWIMNEGEELYMMVPTAVHTVDIDFPSDEIHSTTFPVDTQAFVSVFDAFGNRLSVPVELTITYGHAIFTSNSDTSLTITSSSTESVTVDVRVLSPSYITIQGKTL